MELNCIGMGIYIVQIISIIVLPVLFSNVKAGKKLYCYMASIILLCIIGFRTENVGLYDVKNIYFPQFNSLQKMSFTEMLSVYPIARGNLMQIFTFVYGRISDNKYIWLFLTSVPYVAAMTHTIRRYSLNIYTCSFCFFMICGMRIYQTNFFLIRHSIAMAILIIAFDAIVEKNLKKFVVLLILAGLFHSTAFIFVIAYPLARIKLSWKQLLLLAGGLYVIVFMASDVMSIIFGLMDSNNYYSAFRHRNSGFDSFLFPAICGVQFLIAYILCKKNTIDTEFEKITVNLLCIGTILMGSSTIVGEFYRLSYFFMTVSFAGLGNIIRMERNRILRYALYLGLFVVLTWYMCRGFVGNGLIPYESWLFR